MSSEELILRHSAYRVLLLFVEFCGIVLEGEVKPDEGCWSGACIQRLINNFLLKHMGDAMNREASVQKVWIDLLREMVVKLPKVENLKSYQALCSEDAEQDFFNNVVHLQKHRRARALSRFRNVVSSGSLSEVITNKVFMPFLFNMLLDVQDGKGEHLRNASMDTIASISGCMEWEAYYALLMRCFREMALRQEKQKLLLRLICSILDHFHFFGGHSNHEAERTIVDASSPVTFAVTHSTLLSKCSTSTDVLDIRACLYQNILPKVQKLLTSDSDNVNVNISLAALKLLKLLPSDIIDSQLPSIIHRISNFLKNRLESSREEARSALAACLKELGLEYLQFVVKVLRATLKRGYELHVLGYTLNFILSKCLSKPISGKLDYCLEELLCIVENDIFGNVSEEKEVDKIASKMKETRKNKSFETLKLIAQSITFNTHALKLLLPVTVHLQKQLTPKVKWKLETMLNHIATGIECNPSVNQTDLFIFTYGLIEDGITNKVESSSLTRASKQDKDGVSSTITTSGRLIDADPQCSHLITDFALGMLYNRLKNMKIHKKEEQLLAMLDPFISLLADCLRSKYDDIISSGIKCLSQLVRLPLPSLVSEAERIKTSLLVIAQGSGNASTPLMQSCIRLLTVLLRSTSITLSSDQLHMLIQFPIFADLERNPSFIALSLLKAIVNRRLVVHEIYDIVTQVAELLVTSQVEPVRKKCSQILLQFLLDYRLSKKRLQQHLDFLLANLRYEHSTGREAVLEMLHAIIIKFPQSVVDELSQTTFVHLVVCLANDQDNKVRSMTGAAIKLLIGRVSPQPLDSILQYSLSWYSGGKQHLWSAAAQVLGLLVEVMKERFQRNISSVLSVVRSILQAAGNAVTRRQLDLSSDGTVPFWKEAYYSLVMLEKILHQYPALCTGGELELKAPLIDEGASTVISQNLVFAICGVHSFFGQCANPHEFWSTLEHHEQGLLLRAFQMLDSGKGRSMFTSITSNDQDSNKHHRYMLISYLLKRMGKIALQMEAIQMKIVFDCFKSISPKIFDQAVENESQDYAYQILLPLYKVCEGFAGKVIPDDARQFTQEVYESIRNTIGMQNFVQVCTQIRKNLKAKRDKRKQEEKLMAVVNPERNAKRKLKIAAKHRANKKRKMMGMRVGRLMR
ncbi:hypothetical protein RJ639_018254 [Escallonia herrerae]|uniref:Small subunit processome component 20 homolog n=1 Tax=Escallonia herrerae TaxID=1293975 RepID=A0AA88V952_9ASTE|nr:hypothetical protein RJ639_018254 [Escallonia herrerae]